MRLENWTGQAGGIFGEDIRVGDSIPDASRLAVERPRARRAGRQIVAGEAMNLFRLHAISGRRDLAGRGNQKGQRDSAEWRSLNGWRSLAVTLSLLLNLAAANGCAVWDWARPAADPDAAPPVASRQAPAEGGGPSDRSLAEDGSNASDTDPRRAVHGDEAAPDLVTRFRPRSPRRREDFLLDERSRQIERNLGL